MEKEQYFNPDGRGNVHEDVQAQLSKENLDDDLRFILENLQTKIDTEQHYPVEAKERLWAPRFALLVISGKGSVGNTSTTEFAAKIYGIPEQNVFHAGELFREFRDKMNPNHPDHESIKYIERPEQLDKLIDETQWKKMIEASIDNPQIIESKFGGALLRYLEQQAKNIGVALPSPRAAILKWADSNKRVEIAKKKAGVEVLSVKEIRKQSSERDKKDIEQLNRTHNWFKDFTNIHDKNARDNEGNPLYQDFVDASDHSGPEEDFEDLNEKLVRLGLVVENKTQEMKPQQSIVLGYNPEDIFEFIGDEDPGN